MKYNIKYTIGGAGFQDPGEDEILRQTLEESNGVRASRNDGLVKWGDGFKTFNNDIIYKYNFKEIRDSKIQMRQIFLKHIFKMYNRIDNTKFDDYTVILTGNEVGGFGDMITLFNMYNILKGHINVKVYLLGHSKENIEKLLQISSIEEIGSVTKWSDDIFSGNRAGYNGLKKDILKINEQYSIDIISPDCLGLQEEKFEEINRKIVLTGSKSSICLYEYGYYHEGLNKYKFSTGLLPTELGLYFTKKCDPIEQIDSSKIFFAYFSTDAGNYHNSVKLYVYIMFRHILDNLEVYNEKLIKLYLPNGWTYEEIKDIGEYTFNYTEPNLICQYNGTIITIEVNDKPLSNKEFNELIQKSEIFVGCTGDQSFSEVINCNRIPIYQILNHKINFFDSLISFAEEKQYNTEFLEKHKLLFSAETRFGNTKEDYEEYYGLLKSWIESNFYTGLAWWIKNEFNINDVLIGFAKYWIINKFDSSLINQEIELFNKIFDDDDNLNDSYTTWVNFINKFDLFSGTRDAGLSAAASIAAAVPVATPSSGNKFDLFSGPGMRV